MQKTCRRFPACGNRLHALIESSLHAKYSLNALAAIRCRLCLIDLLEREEFDELVKRELPVAIVRHKFGQEFFGNRIAFDDANQRFPVTHQLILDIEFNITRSTDHNAGAIKIQESKGLTNASANAGGINRIVYTVTRQRNRLNSSDKIIDLFAVYRIRRTKLFGQLQTLGIAANGNDLLAKYKENSSAVDTSLSPDDWMKKLLSSEDASTGLSSADPIMGLVTTMYSSLLALAVQIDSKSEEEQKAQISEAVSKRQVDLKPLMPTMKECVLSVGDNGKAVLQADNGTTKVTRELTNAELCRLSQVLGDTKLSNDAKKMRIAGMVNTIVLTQQASQNYEQVLEQQEGQSQTMQRK